MKFLRLLWRAWMTFARALGKANMLLVLTVLYFVVVPLFSLWRLKDPLAIKLRGRKTQWTEREPVEESTERFARQF